MGEFLKSEEFKEAGLKIIREDPNLNGNNDSYKSTVVESEEEIIQLSNKGYDCQPLGNGKWLMKKGNIT